MDVNVRGKGGGHHYLSKRHGSLFVVRGGARYSANRTESPGVPKRFHPIERAANKTGNADVSTRGVHGSRLLNLINNSCIVALWSY